MVDENGVSEIIGAILLVSLVILGAMIVAVLFLSQPPPQEIPQVNAIAGNNTTHIFLLHDGGDPLTPLETVIRIDGRADPVPAGDIELLREDGTVEESSWLSGEWSVGKTLRIKDDQPPQSVSLIYSGGSSQALLLTSTFVETASGGGGGPEPPEFWTIIASAGTGGSISPSGSVQVPDGGSRSFSISPEQCYNIANIVVDGSDLGAIPSYQFTNVQEDHTINATFAPNTFYIDASVDGGGGTMDPSGNQGPYNCHASQTFSITADLGYIIQDVVVDGISQGAVSTYTFDDIVKNYTIVAYFSPESNFIIDKNVFIYGNNLEFDGSIINGPGATVIITGGLDTSDINGGALSASSNIYVDGDVNLNSGSAGLGSPTDPGTICVNGDLTLLSGSRNIYGDVYVDGNFSLKDARIHDNVYVDGDVTLGWTPWLAEDAYIFYTGWLYPPNNYDQDILLKCINQSSVAGCDMFDGGIPPLPPVRPDDWYAARGYVSGGPLASNLKIFADSYSPSSSTTAAVNVIIIARNGDITLTNLGWIHVSGVLFAPKGKVTFSGDSFEGVVLTRDGFFVTSGGTDVTFRNFEEFFSSPADYPF